ncbi:MAG: amidase [Pirellula sp.]
MSDPADNRDDLALPITSGRRAWFAQCLIAGGVLASSSQATAMASTLEMLSQDEQATANTITADRIRAASWMSRVPLTDAQCEQVATDLNRKAKSIAALRSQPIDENTPMAMTFMPWYFVQPTEQTDAPVETSPSSHEAWKDRGQSLPEFQRIEDAAFWTVEQLAAGLRRHLFSSEQLTQMYLDRLHRFDPLLHCVVSFHDRALEEARRADRELASGHDRGILHGIPWGAKDIISIPGMPTTWGAVDYQTTMRPALATVARRMLDAGAVLLAKLSVGTLAWGDIWFRETTRNPWDPERGSSGSSAGSASATAAGLCAFAIGSETLGSIVSPTRVCCTCGLRPSFGRVSRYGCMTLGWSMDKIGPIARHVEDCGWIFSAITGTDGLDSSVVERPFAWPLKPLEPSKLRVGVPKNMRRSETAIAELFREKGATMIDVDLPADPCISAMTDAISVEAAAMHGDLFGKIESDSQIGQWGPSFREAQFASAIDYVQAMRARVELVRNTETALRSVDILIGDGDLARMNLTGHPSVVVAFGNQAERARPNTVVLTSKYFAESKLLQAGTWIQSQIPPTPAQPSLI